MWWRCTTRPRTDLSRLLKCSFLVKFFFLAAYKHDAGPKGIPAVTVGSRNKDRRTHNFTIKDLATRCDTKSFTTQGSTIQWEWRVQANVTRVSNDSEPQNPEPSSTTRLRLNPKSKNFLSRRISGTFTL